MNYYDYLWHKVVVYMLAHKHSCTHLLSSMAGTGTDGTQVFLLPLVSNLVHFAIIVTRRLIWGEGEILHFRTDTTVF